MTITVTNQKPAVLDPVYSMSPAGVFDPRSTIRATCVDPLFAPLATGTSASIMDGSNPLDPDAVMNLFMRCLGQTVDPGAEQTSKELLGQTLVHYDQNTTLPMAELFAVQAGQTNKLPMPSARVRYTAASDVIPAAKGLLAGNNDASLFFASLAYTFAPTTLGFWFTSSADFEDFKTWLSGQTQAMSAALPADTTKLLSDFTGLSLNKLTESLLLRRDDDDNNEEHSFARMIIHQLMSYVSMKNQGPGHPGVGVLPFNVGELFCPRSLVLVNVEAHARATDPRVAKEWGLINNSLANPINIVSNKSLMKLTSLSRAANRAAFMSAQQRPGQPGSRSANVRFRRKPPKSVDLLADIMRALKRMGKVNKSQNVFRTTRTTFTKANRRDPDDYNKPGRITSVHYMPDLHIYLDCSGSISEENYQDSVLMLIKLAKKLNINLYFNSFSHFMSQEVMLRTENKSVRAIWKEFRRLPKVSGGTNYSQIWDYVNASNVRKRRLSLVITDFDWQPPATRAEHPPNLYYAPCSAMDWTMLVKLADHFATNMKHIDPTVRQKLMGMVK